MPGFVASLSQQQCDNLGSLTSGELVFQNEHHTGYAQKLKAQRQGIASAQVSHDDLVVTLWGDIFSIAGEDTTATQALEQIITSYQAHTLDSLLAQLNGYFIISLLDQRTQQVLFISDRYGMKPLYLWQQGSEIKALASEPKELLQLNAYQGGLDSANLEMFIDLGHCIGDKTLYQDISRLPPATKLTISLATGDSTSERYWSWRNIKANNDITFDQAVTELGSLFDQAMRRSISTIKQDKLAITLSGGLDSRVLLAAATKYFNGQIHTYTFGESGCADHVIAKQVSDLAGATHHFIAINGEQWFDGREQGVWLTDGLKNALHMHALSSVATISESSNYLLNGYLGDVTAGGSYIMGTEESEKATLAAIKQRYGKHYQAAIAESDYFDLNNEENVFIYNRGSRFIAAGSDLLSHQLHQLKPFMDNDLVDFLYSLPKSYRQDGRLYHHMLLNCYPDFFVTIPWQQTGKPISKKPLAVAKSPGIKVHLKAMIIGSPLEQLARKWYRQMMPKHHYVAYDLWLREPKFKDYVEQLLLEQGELQQVMGETRIRSYLSAFYNSKNPVKPEVIGSLLTIELYLRQINRHRKELGSNPIL